MATYTTRLSAQAKAKHVPLGQALREYAGVANRDKLLSLLVPVQRAAERCGWLKKMVDKGEIFHPLRWEPAEAARFLNSAPDLERAGVVVRMPANWRAGRPARPRVTATVGARQPAGAGLDALLDFQMDVTLEGGVAHRRRNGHPTRGYRDIDPVAWSMGGDRSGTIGKRDASLFRGAGPRRTEGFDLRGGHAPVVWRGGHRRRRANHHR